ncbi:MAG: bifunctional DNA-formamidopyrimidine glycosylase/DNA-(apurinic or apyrimidinic site) lyase [Desulfobulbaceae bacterium]
MPELPEVEVTRLGLLPAVTGRRVVQLSFSGKDLRFPLDRALLKRFIRGGLIRTVDRRGKYLLFRMRGGAVMVLHLGMSGKLTLAPPDMAPADHDHLRLLLDSGMELRLNDARRFGSVTVWPPAAAGEEEDRFSEKMGVEPFDTAFSPGYLHHRAATRHLPVKNFLMDGRIVAGIGNIYANEILFGAAVHPLCPASSLSMDDWRRIVAAARHILAEAIASGGSTISDFLGTSGNPGYFQLRFAVYDRKDAECRRCGAAIVRIVCGGRATFFCSCCQPLPPGLSSSLPG